MWPLCGLYLWPLIYNSIFSVASLWPLHSSVVFFQWIPLHRGGWGYTPLTYGCLCRHQSSRFEFQVHIAQDGLWPPTKNMSQKDAVTDGSCHPRFHVSCSLGLWFMVLVVGSALYRCPGSRPEEQQRGAHTLLQLQEIPQREHCQLPGSRISLLWGVLWKLDGSEGGTGWDGSWQCFWL